MLSELTAKLRFDPAPAIAEQVIHDYANPDFTLHDLASRCDTTIEALSLWLHGPEIAPRLHSLSSAAAVRTGFLASNTLPSVVKVLTTILRAYLDEEGCLLRRPDNFQALEAYRRTRESARRAAALLVKLTNPNALTVIRASTASPVPNGGGGRGSARPEGASSAVEGQSRRKDDSEPYSRAAEAAAFLQQLLNDNNDDTDHDEDNDDGQDDDHELDVSDDTPLVDRLSEPDIAANRPPPLQSRSRPTRAHHTPHWCKPAATLNSSSSLVVQASGLHPNSASPAVHASSLHSAALSSRALEEGATTPPHPPPQDNSDLARRTLEDLINTTDLSSFPTRPGHAPPTLYGPNGAYHPQPQLSATHPP